VLESMYKISSKCLCMRPTVVNKYFYKDTREQDPNIRVSSKVFLLFLKTIYPGDFIYLNIENVFEYYESEFEKIISYVDNLNHRVRKNFYIYPIRHIYNELNERVMNLFRKDKYDVFVVCESYEFYSLVYPRSRELFLDHRNEFFTVKHAKRWILYLFAKTLDKQFFVKDPELIDKHVCSEMIPNA